MNEAHAGTSANIAAKLGVKAGELVQEFGYDEDVDQELRRGIERVTGAELIEEAVQELVDVALVWYREDEDIELDELLVDVGRAFDQAGLVWLLTPKPGRSGYVSPACIEEAAPVAGWHATKTAGVSQHWAATCLAPQRDTKNH